MPELPFDLASLAAAIERERVARGLTVAGLARDAGVSSSTIRRFATASDAEADGVLAAIGWLGVAPEDFVADSTVVGTRLAPVLDGMIRVDLDAVAALPTWTGGSRVGSRTTIQRLVTAAQSSGRAVASLTRWSPV
ncbi:MAG: hypothetical protein AAGD33_22940 [Actinomycetota bacterium]